VSAPKAVALYSGGLDSTLAILTVLRQGIEVKAVTFLNHFGCDISDRSSCSRNPFPAAEKFGFEVKLSHLSGKFLEIVKHPKFGHGKNMNPCMDCRILMLREAKEFMDMAGAEFIITGEVLGQRPMSQRRDALDIIDREAGLRGHIVRPLSAKLLKPTAAEEKGIVDRQGLFGFSGRSRKPQIALAREFGLTDYPAPAGGCLLTEPNYSHRLRELLVHDTDPSLTDLQLLRIGRHFRLGSGCKLIVGRNKAENELLLKMEQSEGAFLMVKNFGSPIAFLQKGFEKEDIMTAAAICARYSDAKSLQVVAVTVCSGPEEFPVATSPARDETIEGFKIEKKEERARQRGLDSVTAEG
jgi:tRNA-uridine 2-sulfurtransferase